VTRRLTIIAIALLLAPALAHAQDFRPQVSDEGKDQMSVRGFIWGSVKLLAVEHAVRIAFQEKTRSELGGNFFKDYVRSVRTPKSWEDGDPWIVNYVGHPIHGAAAGFRWIEQESTNRTPQFGLGGSY